MTWRMGVLRKMSRLSAFMICCVVFGRNGTLRSPISVGFRAGIAHGGSLIFSASMLTPGSYCVVFDTLIEDLPADMFPDRRRMGSGRTRQQPQDRRA